MSANNHPYQHTERHVDEQLPFSCYTSNQIVAACRHVRRRGTLSAASHQYCEDGPGISFALCPPTSMAFAQLAYLGKRREKARIAEDVRCGLPDVLILIRDVEMRAPGLVSWLQPCNWPKDMCIRT
jgi:hypothetical protein